MTDLTLHTGQGLQLTAPDTIALDCSADDVWTGNHMFVRPVAFARDQAFSVTQLTVPNQSRGDLLFHNGASWTRLPFGNAGLALVSSNGLPAWGQLDLSKSVTNVLRIENGGTGMGTYRAGDLLYASSSDKLAVLHIGSHGQTLIIGANGPEWADPTWANVADGAGGAGEIAFFRDASRALHSDPMLRVCTTSAVNDTFRLTGVNPRIQLNNELLSGLVSLYDGTVLNFGVNVSTLGSRTDTQPGARIWLDTRVESANQMLALAWIDSKGVAAHTTWAISREGALSIGTVSVDHITGTLTTVQGGTGISSYRPGDLLFASDINVLGRLSTVGASGKLLGCVNGLPVWVDASSGGNTSIPVRLNLAPGTADEAALRFTAGAPVNPPQPGALEYDGTRLTLTTQDASRRTIAFCTDDVEGTAVNIRGMASLEHGGTGADLTAQALVGSVLCLASEEAMGWVQTSATGLFLRSQGPRCLPVWDEAIARIKEGTGIQISGSRMEPVLSVDTSAAFQPIWSGRHTFSADVLFDKQAMLKLSAGLQLLPAPSPASPQSGQLWFDGAQLYFYAAGITCNLSQPLQKTTHHRLEIVAGVTPQNGMRVKRRIPLPYSPDNGIVPLRWRFRRVDWRSEDPADGAILRLWVGEQKLIEMTLQGQSASVTEQNFYVSASDSGELIQAEIVRSGGGDCWSVWLQIESLP